MRKSLSIVFTIISCLLVSSAFSQQVIRGTVTNASTSLPLPAVSVLVSGTGEGTFTDDNGNFSLKIQGSLPATLNFSSIGFHSQSFVVNNESTEVKIAMEPAPVLGQDVVVSATRTPARIMESPVTIQAIGEKEITRSTSPTYYDMVSKLTGVDMVTASLLFSSPSTRGFNGSGNLRMNQIMDGMDNQAPGLNFSVSSIVGVTQLDVDRIELLSGASSALYGPGGMNGALVITSKDPFKFQGFSFDMKTGLMNVKNPDRNPSAYYDWSMRWAKKITDKFAFKITGELTQAKDWVANDYRDYSRTGTTGHLVPGSRETDPNYDGVNVYGDETTVDIMANVLKPLAAQAPFYAPYINSMPSSISVSRTGYKEKDILNPNAMNFKVSGMLSYKVTQNTSLNAVGYFGTGNTVYTGSDRYSLLDLRIGQYKIEMVNPHWFLRAYTTQENAGQSFNATVTTRLTNEAWKPSGGSNGWYFQYAMTYLNDKIAGMSDIDAHNAARAVADQGRPEAGSAQFKNLFNQVRSIPISQGGGLFVDRTDLYVTEGQYDFSQYTHSFADILVGADYKRFVLNSEGTLFADSTGSIPINEVGVYAQLTKKLADERLTIIASGRYDKNENFAGKFTPRVSFVYKVADNNNIRVSYQQAYRFGSTQQQYINLRVGGGTALIGGVESFTKFYHFDTNPVYFLNDLMAGQVQPYKLKKFKSETVNSVEAGYRGLLAEQRLLIDLYGYYGIYKDFITRPVFAQSVNGDPSVFSGTQAHVVANLNNPAIVTTYAIPQNVDGDVKTYGFGLTLTYLLPKNFSITANTSSDDLSDVPPGFIAAFNAPKYRAGISFANSGFGFENRYGFNIGFKWQDKVDYQGDFANGIIPAFRTLDAQLSYKLPQQRVLLKVGGTNILNQYYRDGFGNANIGGLYYVSVGYNIF